jgi:cytochrome c556
VTYPPEFLEAYEKLTAAKKAEVDAIRAQIEALEAEIERTDALFAVAVVMPPVNMDK